MGRRRIIYIFLILVLISAAGLILFSCDPIALRQLVEERINAAGGGLPSVVSVTPEDGATGVDRKPDIVVVFNKSMNPESINIETITLAESSTPVTATVSYNDDTFTATITPTSDLALLTNHDVMISATVADLNGNTIGTDYSSSFQVRDRIWLGAVRIAQSAAADSPKVTIDSSGNCTVTWIENTTTIYANRYTQGGGWSTNVTIGGGAPVVNNAIDADSTGKVVTVYEETSFVNANRFANGSWSSSLLISGGTGSPHTNPDIGMGGNDYGIAVFERGGEIWFNELSAGVWMGETTVDTGASAWSPRVGVADDHSALLIDIQPGGGTDVAAYTRSGSTWSSGTNIRLAPGPVTDPQLTVVKTTGDAVAAWREYTTQVFAHMYNDVTAVWPGPAAKVYEGDTINSGPQVTMNEQNTAWVILQAGSAIYVNRYQEGWTGAQNIGGGGFPYIEVDEDNKAIAIWIDPSGVWARRFDPTASGWGTAVLVSSVSSVPSSPHFAMNSEGQAVAVWVQDADIWANVFD